MYHTALSPEETDAEPRDWWAGFGCEAFVHDVTSGFPPEFGEADVIYAEPPWADGYEEFARRAATSACDEILLPTFEDWCYLINGYLAAWRKPWVVLVGARAARCIGGTWMRKVTLNGGVAALKGAWCPPPPPELTDALDVIQWLSGNPEYRTVADFCAGYGNTARIFAEAGKQFVVTDLNPRCIGHIAREAPTWLSVTS